MNNDELAMHLDREIIAAEYSADFWSNQVDQQKDTRLAATIGDLAENAHAVVHRLKHARKIFSHRS